jgi:hypothetical protein
MENVATTNGDSRETEAPRWAETRMNRPLLTFMVRRGKDGLATRTELPSDDLPKTCYPKGATRKGRRGGYGEGRLVCGRTKPEEAPTSSRGACGQPPGTARKRFTYTRRLAV